MRKHKTAEIKAVGNKLFKGFRGNSLTRDVLFSIIKSIRITARGTMKLTKLYCSLFEGMDPTSIHQKFRGTYYANKEDVRLREESIKKWETRRAIKALQKMNYIKINDAKKRIYLTEKGLLEFIKSKIHSNKSIWDKKWRIIVFDIPENKRKQRDFLRTRLKWLGFKELQKSVWIFPYDIKKELQEVLNICGEYDIGGDVRFMTVDKIEEDKDLKEYFNLL